MKRILFLLVALIAGAVALVTGITHYKDSKQLQANGKTTRAKVLKAEAEETVSRRGSRTTEYYLTVWFQPEQGQAQAAKRWVSIDRFNRAIKEKSIGVVYLPSNPAVFQLGDKAETRYSSIVFGSIFIVGALGFIAYLFVSHRSSKQQGWSASSPQPVPAPAANDQQKAA